MIKPGPTGEFPDGKIRDDDKGAINVRIDYDREQQILSLTFGAEISWLGMPRDNAINFAFAILTACGIIVMDAKATDVKNGRS